MDRERAAAYWEANAETWTQLSRAGYDVYRDNVNTPGFLAMLPPIAGLHGLDIGCGEGTNTRALAKLGARMTAIDVAPPFVTLSDGEKCFFICALVLAANEAYGPIFCFWDEPDSHLAIDEVGHFVTALRRSFENGGGQVLMTSHNSEAIRRFSDENTMVLLRESHLEPTRVKSLEEIGVKGDLINTLLRGDIGT